MFPLSRRIALASALAAALSLPVLAQTASSSPSPFPAAAPAAGPGFGARAQAPERMQQRHADRLARLKETLRITPEQESAWQAFSQAMQPLARPGPQDREAWQRLSTPERIDRMRALRQQRNAEMDRRGDATKALYAALSPEQQQRMDAWGPRPGDGRGRHGRHHGGRMMD